MSWVARNPSMFGICSCNWTIRSLIYLDAIAFNNWVRCNACSS
jgi:hypothetical protein